MMTVLTVWDAKYATLCFWCETKTLKTTIYYYLFRVTNSSVEVTSILCWDYLPGNYYKNNKNYDLFIIMHNVNYLFKPKIQSVVFVLSFYINFLL